MLSITLIILNWGRISYIRTNDIINFIYKYNEYIILIYLGIYCLKPFFLVIPSNVVVIIGGILFNPFIAFFLSMTGFFISGTISFYISRYLGRGFVEGIVGDKFIKLDTNLKENGFKIILCLRLPPILPYDPLSYTCGLTNVSYRSFITASLIGVIPETLCYSIIADNFTSPLSPQFIIPVIFLIIAIASAAFFINYGKNLNKTKE